jgi:hypothetical protein
VTTLANAQMGFPVACTATNLYIIQRTANAAGRTTTATLNVNGSDTALTGTITSASGSGGTGVIAIDTSHSVSIAQGDLVALKLITNTSTSGTMGGWAMACD